MNRHVFGFLATFVTASLLGLACNNQPQLRSRCASDEECVELNGRPDWICHPDRGRCACVSDEACGEQEHCEPLPGGDGYCHPNRICEWNDDCDRGEFCDIATSICRRSGCSLDVQCPLGEVCDLRTSTCVPGCRTHGDCWYREVCLCQGDEGLEACTCDADTEAGRRSCAIGTCASDTCTENEHCEWGQICVVDEATGLRVCKDDERGPYCEVCHIDPGNAMNLCEGASNFCLRDTSGTGPAFCGVSCANDEPCPNGFRCADILIPTDKFCTSHATCLPPPGARTCETDDDCDLPRGRCVDGRCAGYCLDHEGAVEGFCSCVTDDQCPTQKCSSGRCELTGTLCFDDKDCEGEIVCHIGRDNYGYCKVGRNCAPQEGVLCLEVREIRSRR